MRVADAKAAANRSLGVDRIGEADARPKVGVVRVDEGLSVGPAGVHRSDAIACNSSRRRGEYGLGGGIEVGDVVIQLTVGRAVLPAQTDIQSKVRKRLPVVLRVDVVRCSA